MEWITRFNGVQVASNIPPHIVHEGVIIFKDGTSFNVNTHLLLNEQEEACAQLLDEHDSRRVADDAVSDPSRPIIDMVDCGGGTCIVYSHEGRFAISGYGKAVVNISGQDSMSFGSMTLDLE